MDLRGWLLSIMLMGRGKRGDPATLSQPLRSWQGLEEGTSHEGLQTSFLHQLPGNSSALRWKRSRSKWGRGQYENGYNGIKIAVADAPLMSDQELVSAWGMSTAASCPQAAAATSVGPWGHPARSGAEPVAAARAHAAPPAPSKLLAGDAPWGALPPIHSLGDNVLCHQGDGDLIVLAAATSAAEASPWLSLHVAQQVMVLLLFPRPARDHYFPDLHHLKYELEEGTTPAGRAVRFGYNPLEFEGFSWRGYAQMSSIQVCLLSPSQPSSPSGGCGRWIDMLLAHIFHPKCFSDPQSHMVANINSTVYI